MLEREKCGQCGLPRSECSDPDVDWFPQREICYASQALAAASGLYEDLHKDAPYHDGSWQSWRKERDHSHPFHFRDGVSLSVAREDLNPEDDFLRLVAGSEQPGRDVDEAHD